MPRPVASWTGRRAGNRLRPVSGPCWAPTGSDCHDTKCRSSACWRPGSPCLMWWWASTSQAKSAGRCATPTRRTTCWAACATWSSPSSTSRRCARCSSSSGPWSSSWRSRRRWRRWARWPVAWRTTSTTSWPPSWATPTWHARIYQRAIRRGRACTKSAVRRGAGANWCARSWLSAASSRWRAHRSVPTPSSPKPAACCAPPSAPTSSWSRRWRRTARPSSPTRPGWGRCCSTWGPTRCMRCKGSRAGSGSASTPSGRTTRRCRQLCWSRAGAAAWVRSASP